MKSAISNARACYICGNVGDLHKHHCIFGSKRKKADEDGLWVYLCPSCHNAIHRPASKFDQSMQNALKKIAQEAYEKTNTRADFIKRYGKTYL